MASTYDPIASQTLGSNTATVNFSNIPGVYTDLVLVFNGAQTGGSGETSSFLRVNSDTNGNYSRTVLTGNGSSAFGGRSSNATWINLSLGGAGVRNMHIIQFMSYANTSVNKTILIAGATPAINVTRQVGLWRSTSAITSITLTNDQYGSSFGTGATFALYGIKAA